MPIKASPARRLLVIHNPVAGHDGDRRRLADVLARLEGLGCAVDLRETARRGDAEMLAREACPDRVDVVVAAGGDGTVNEVVNGLVSGPGGLMLGVVPLGSANVLACEIGLEVRDTALIARTIAGAAPRKVYLGTANGRHFVLMAGAGLDAQVVEGVAGAKRSGRFAYVMEGLKQAFEYDFPALQIRADGITYEGRMAVACKGRFYGGPYVAAPGAALHEPRLHVCILPKSGASGAMRYGLALPMGRLADLPEVRVVATDRVTIVGPRGAPVQADGDIIARLPAEIAVARETVDLIMPAMI